MTDSKSEEPDTKIVLDSENRKPPAAGMGRPKGAVNKTTALLKDAILKAAALADPAAIEGTDGTLEGYLKWAAKESPGPFIGLLGKVLPLQIAGSLNLLPHEEALDALE